jgi:hypothetical protein
LVRSAAAQASLRSLRMLGCDARVSNHEAAKPIGGPPILRDVRFLGKRLSARRHFGKFFM